MTEVKPQFRIFGMMLIYTIRYTKCLQVLSAHVPVTLKPISSDFRSDLDTRLSRLLKVKGQFLFVFFFCYTLFSVTPLRTNMYSNPLFMSRLKSCKTGLTFLTFPPLTLCCHTGFKFTIITVTIHSISCTNTLTIDPFEPVVKLKSLCAPWSAKKLPCQPRLRRLNQWESKHCCSLVFKLS